MLVDLVKRRRLPVGPHERSRRQVVPIGLQLAQSPLVRSLVIAVPSAHVQGHAMQVIGREIRPEIGPVPVHGAKLHQPVREKLLLPFKNLLLGEQNVPRLVHDPLGDRRVVLVNPDRRKRQDREPNDECHDRTLQPERRDCHGTANCHAR